MKFDFILPLTPPPVKVLTNREKKCNIMGGPGRVALPRKCLQLSASNLFKMFKKLPKPKPKPRS